MDTGIKANDLELELFCDSRSVEGRFLSYCRGRVSHFWSRQVLVLVCFPFFLFVAAPVTAILTALVVLAGDALDCVLLRYVERQAPLKDRLQSAIRLTTLSGGVQALTICVFVSQVYLSGGEAARSFASAICLAALLDAGMLHGVHRRASAVRILAYGVALVGMLAHIWFQASASDLRPVFDTAAVLLLAHVIWSMVRHTDKTRKRRNADRLATLENARELAQSNKELDASRQTARRLAMVVERANDSVIITNSKGVISWVNRGFTRMTGYSGTEAVGRDVTFLNGPQSDPHVIAHLLECRAEQRPTRAEIVNYRKDGRRIWVEVSMTPVFDDQGQLRDMVSVERDISDVKRRERALAESRIVAEKAVRARHNFLATMSHEIRTPMNGIIGTADMLLETTLTELQHGLARTINSSGEALLSIVNDILDFTKLEAGKFDTIHEPFSPEICLRNAFDLVRPLADAKGLSFDLNWPSDFPHQMVGDEGRLRQVFLNLLGNAIKFTESGSVNVDVFHRRIAGHCHLRIDVRDTGIGIPPDRLNNIFDSFSQVDRNIAGRFGGTGLGLSISRLLVRAMGGEITVSSTPDKGSIFTLSLALPLSSAAEAPALLDKSDRESRPADPPLTGIRVLVAEDNRTNTLLLDRMLSSAGVDLIFAVNGREAVDLFAVHSPDLILMDMHMPILDGPSATREIRKIEAATSRQEVPIIALTANVFPEDREMCMASGMSAVMTKPFRKQNLLDALRNHLSSDLDATVRDVPQKQPVESA